MSQQLICVGLSYKTAPVDVRERAAIANPIPMLNQVAAGQAADITELVILSTCNRTEFYAVGESEALYHLFATASPLTDQQLQPVIYCLTDQVCVSHLFRVAAGLDSQIIGEPQILGQIGDAYQQSAEHHAAGPILSMLMQQALHAGKRVRHETELSRGALSVSSLAAQYATQAIGSLTETAVLIIGAGKMAQSAAEALSRRGLRRLIIANRSGDHAQLMADQLGGTAVTLSQITEVLVEADIVITALSVTHPALYVADVASILPRRQGRPLLIFDIAMPRNVAPAVGKLQGVRLCNLDDLENAAEAHRRERESAIPQAEAIVNEEARLFAEWQASRVITPVIQQLRAQAETVRQAELEHLIRRLPDLDDHHRRLLDDFSHRLVNKLLHQPTIRLKEQSAEGHAELYASVLDDLFGLKVATS